MKEDILRDYLRSLNLRNGCYLIDNKKFVNNRWLIKDQYRFMGVGNCIKNKAACIYDIPFILKEFAQNNNIKCAVIGAILDYNGADRDAKLYFAYQNEDNLWVIDNNIVPYKDVTIDKVKLHFAYRLSETYPQPSKIIVGEVNNGFERHCIGLRFNSFVSRLQANISNRIIIDVAKDKKELPGGYECLT